MKHSSGHTYSQSLGACAWCALATFRFVDLQIDASVILHADNAEQCTNSLCGVAHAADDLSHVLRIDIKCKKYSHVVGTTVYDDLLRFVDEGLYKKLKKFFVAVCLSHNVNLTSIKLDFRNE